MPGGLPASSGQAPPLRGPPGTQRTQGTSLLIAVLGYTMSLQPQGRPRAQHVSSKDLRGKGASSWLTPPRRAAAGGRERPGRRRTFTEGLRKEMGHGRQGCWGPALQGRQQSDQNRVPGAPLGTAGTLPKARANPRTHMWLKGAAIRMGAGTHGPRCPTARDTQRPETPNGPRRPTAGDVQWPEMPNGRRCPTAGDAQRPTMPNSWRCPMARRPTAGDAQGCQKVGPPESEHLWAGSLL